jgi:hypothetical protein
MINKNNIKYAPFTIFGQTKSIPVVVWQNNKQIQSDVWDTDLWIERSEDWYALMSSGLINKRVRIIEREIWLKS